VPARRSVLLPLSLGALCAGWALAVQAAGDPRACVTIADDAARLACYDSAFERATPSQAAGPTGAAQAPEGAAVTAPASAPPTRPPAAPRTPAAAAAPVAAAPAPRNPEAEFGLTEAGKARKNPEKAAEKAREPSHITAVIISVQYRKYGEFIVTLDNGQVWEQNEPMPSAKVEVGDTITIKKGWLGSFMLVTAGHIGTKVHRTD
jgi:hypothetical protein